MSLALPGRAARRAAGRLCFVDFAGTAPTARIEHLIAESHIAGVVLFSKNIASPAQVAGLAAALQAVARETGAPPPVVAIDHEGGSVTRFPTGAAGATSAAPTPLPGAMALGAAGDPVLAAAAGRVAGRELRAMGIHLNFAPVLDVNTRPGNPIIGTRAFGDRPGLVALMGAAYIRGIQDTGVGATAKHFPGHGDASVDSHLGLPRVEHGARRLEDVDLAPFAVAARMGVAAVMTAHMVYPALDPAGVPATISAPVLTGILRERWGYRGLVCTDSLSMRAIADHHGAGEAAVAAIAAGCDVALALGPDGLQDEVLDRLARALEGGAIGQERVAASGARMERLHLRWQEAGSPQADTAGATAPGAEAPGAAAAGADTPGAAAAGEDGVASVGAPAHHDIARRIAEAAVTVVRDRTGILPLRDALIEVVPVGDAARQPGADLVAALRRHGGRAEVMAEPSRVGHQGLVVAVTCSRGLLDPLLAGAVLGLHRGAGDRLVLLAVGDPYDLMAVPDASAFVATYGTDGPTLDAAARVLLGTIRARGRLPVTIPGLKPSASLAAGGAT